VCPSYGNANRHYYMNKPVSETILDALIGVQFALNAQVYQQTGLALDDYKVLDAATSNAVASGANPSFSDNVAGLVKKGLLEKVSIDESQSYYCPSAEGRELLRRADIVATSALSNVFGKLTDSERRLLRKLARNA
jgi:hypothetical protein